MEVPMKFLAMGTALLSASFLAWLPANASAAWQRTRSGGGGMPASSGNV